MPLWRWLRIQFLKTNIFLKNLKIIVFDFDGVLTNNNVFLNSSGEEFVSCSRADGIAFNIFKKIGIKTLILSTESNSVVSARAQKLSVPVIQSVSNKLLTLEKYLNNNNLTLKNVMFVGNDLNDLKVMQNVAVSCCPSDSHQKIKEISTHILNTKGGHGVAREVIEDILQVNVVDYL